MPVRTRFSARPDRACNGITIYTYIHTYIHIHIYINTKLGGLYHINQMVAQLGTMNWQSYGRKWPWPNFTDRTDIA